MTNMCSDLFFSVYRAQSEDARVSLKMRDWKEVLLMLLVANSCFCQTTEEWQKFEEEVFGGDNNTGNKSGDISLNPTRKHDEEVSCRQDDGSKGVCVVYYQCDNESKNLITDGSTLINIRIDDNRPCKHHLDTCCGHEQVNKTQPMPETGGAGQCGYTNPGAAGDGGFRISDNEFAQFAEFPWMLAILKKELDDGVFTPKNYVGGASLIHPRVALTSAHKTHGLRADALKVRAGEWDTQTERETFPYQERDVAKIVTHDQFYRPSMLNNVALLFLQTELTLMPHIDVACVAHAVPQPGTHCFSMGWGKENFGDQNPSKYAVILKKIVLPLVSRDKCQTALRRTRLGNHFVLHSSFMCAGGKKGVDTCSGDGGSPLVCPIGNTSSGRFAVVGTVAWGIGCADDGVPGVYTDVTKFASWIREKVAAERLPTDGFDYITAAV